MALVTVAALGLVSAAAPLWSRGTYMKLEFAADLSSTLSYDGVVFESASPAAAGAKAEASSGADGLLGGYDELRLGQSLAVRYYTGHDAFVFERTYPLPISASTVNVMAAGPSAGDCSAVDVSGFYESVANAGGTLPGALTDINTVTQVGCHVIVGGESVCNTATATIFNASFINGTSSCIAHRWTSAWAVGCDSAPTPFLFFPEALADTNRAQTAPLLAAAAIAIAGRLHTALLVVHCLPIPTPLITVVTKLASLSSPRGADPLSQARVVQRDAPQLVRQRGLD